MILSKVLDRDKFKKRESILIPTYLEYEESHNQNNNSLNEKSIHENEDDNEHTFFKNSMNPTPQNEVLAPGIPLFANPSRLQTDNDEDLFDKTPEFKFDCGDMLRKPSEAMRKHSFINNDFNTIHPKNSLFEEVSLSKRENDNFLNLPNFKEQNNYNEDFHIQKNTNDFISYKNSIEKSQMQVQINNSENFREINQDLIEKEIKSKLFQK